MKTEKCRWTYNGDEYSYYDTECGEMHIFEAGDVQDNKHRFCPYCGKPIREVGAARAVAKKLAKTLYERGQYSA